ncbi:MAG: hypothetical protein ABIR24_01920 [Verrucomicrobiota bacterium]
MDEPINPASRPSRLSLFVHVAVVGLLLVSFISGAVIWYGQNANDMAGLDSARFNVQIWRTLHGILNPFLCIAFGYLLCQHIRLGWEMKANRLSGFFMEAIFALLILTGAGIYYAPENCQKVFVSGHRISGLLVPLSLTIHWIAAQIWVKKTSQK